MIIAYYFANYYHYKRNPHPFIKIDKIEKIIDFFINGEIETCHSTTDCYELNFYSIIDEHFKTKYKNCNYNIFHFLSNGILETKIYKYI